MGESDPCPRAIPRPLLFVGGVERGIDQRRGEPLSLELHHVSGDENDDRLDNLQLVCPNCHSLTDNWGGRAKTARAA